MEKLLTSTEAAKLLGVTRQRVVQMAESGAIPSSRFGKALAFRRADVERAKHRQKPGRPKKDRKEKIAR